MPFPADCVDGEVRLMEGEFEWEGRLEICFGQRWGTVGSDGWAQKTSEIVCRDLGYTEPDTGTKKSILFYWYHSRFVRNICMKYCCKYIISY